MPTPPYTLTEGPFAGLTLPHKRADANAQYIHSLVDAYMITHPHLDHIAGFVINTAGPPGARPKKLAGLPGTISAFKQHIFNNVIWPNLSDENNGAGLVTYLRLVEGGSPALGDGEGKGYSEICDGLLVKIWGVSHGHCIEKHSHRGSVSSTCDSPRRDSQRRPSLLSQATLAGASTEQEKVCVYDSSAYFIQSQQHSREVLIFGDVEPDSISLSPRNLQIWQEAAPKIAAGSLAAMFIECSYDDSRENDRLFGHLKPMFVMEEMKVLAGEVERARSLTNRKRKRVSAGLEIRRSFPKMETVSSELISPEYISTEDPVSPRSSGSENVGFLDTPTPTDGGIADEELMGAFMPPDPLLPVVAVKRPLEGLKVVIIHVKDKLTDEPEAGETILNELQAHEKLANLGCEFIMAKSGQSFYF